MSQKKDLLQQYDYPNLSDQEQQQSISQKPNKKIKLDTNIKGTIDNQRNKPFGGFFPPPPSNFISLPGNVFIPPPPPQSAKNNDSSYYNKNRNYHTNNAHDIQNQNHLNFNNRHNQNYNQNFKDHRGDQQNYNYKKQGHNNQYNYNNNNYNSNRNQGQRSNYFNQNDNFYNNQNNRQKKNIVYVKNIPNHFNTSDKIMTFFRNQGMIKDVKVNEVEHSAIVRFVKQEQALKFVKSSKIIFNRSYITYSDEENFLVSQQLIKERIADQEGNAKKPMELQFKLAKERMDTILAQRIRALYYLQANLKNQSMQRNNLLQDKENKDKKYQQKNSSTFLDDFKVNQQLQYSIKLKQNLINMSQSQFNSLQSDVIKNLNWSLNFIKTTSFQYQKKHLLAQYQKIGPISHSQIVLVQQIQKQVEKKQNQIQSQQVLLSSGQKGKKIQEKSQQDQQCKQKDSAHQISNNWLQSQKIIEYKYKVTIQYLTPKSSWQFYLENHLSFQIFIEGAKIRKIFNSGKLKRPIIKAYPAEQKVQIQETINNSVEAFGEISLVEKIQKKRREKLHLKKVHQQNITELAKESSDEQNIHNCSQQKSNQKGIQEQLNNNRLDSLQIDQEKAGQNKFSNMKMDMEYRK